MLSQFRRQVEQLLNEFDESEDYYSDPFMINDISDNNNKERKRERDRDNMDPEKQGQMKDKFNKQPQSQSSLSQSQQPQLLSQSQSSQSTQPQLLSQSQSQPQSQLQSQPQSQLQPHSQSQSPFSRWNNMRDFFMVKCDVIEHEKEYLMTAELPGITKDDVKISVKNDILTISGEKKQEKKIIEQGNIKRTERCFGKFSRSIRLPRDADESKITATQEHGVLTVTIPRIPSEQTQRSVPIK